MLADNYGRLPQQKQNNASRPTMYAIFTPSSSHTLHHNWRHEYLAADITNKATKFSHLKEYFSEDKIEAVISL